MVARPQHAGFQGCGEGKLPARACLSPTTFLLGPLYHLTGFSLIFLRYLLYPNSRSVSPGSSALLILQEKGACPPRLLIVQLGLETKAQ